MKSRASISEKFGLTHREMAQVLGIGQSLWSMYETGARSLPLHAQELLAMMLQNLGANQTPARKIRDPMIRPYLERHIAQLLRKNEFRRALILRKIASVEKKLQTTIARERTLEIITQNQPFNRNFKQRPMPMLASKRTDALRAQEQTLLELHLALELLDAEKKFLDKRKK